MENKRNELDELLKGNMQFDENELPEPDKGSYMKLRGMIKPQKNNRNVFLRLLTFEVKLYQAGLALAAVIIVMIMLRPIQVPQNIASPGSDSSDTASVFKGSSLKHDTFLVRNFSTSIY